MWKYEFGIYVEFTQAGADLCRLMSRACAKFLSDN